MLISYRGEAIHLALGTGKRDPWDDMKVSPISS